MDKVLITGGAGFIGFHLAKHMVEEGYRVDVTDNLSRGLRDEDFVDLCESKGIEFFECDLRDRGAIEGLLGSDYAFIFHLAAIIGVSNVLERPYEVLRDNVEMTVNVLDLARKQGGLKRFVFTSTSEVYAGTLKYFELPIPTPEQTPLAITDLGHARTSYMLSKIYGEALCRQGKIPFTIIRPHNVYGPRMGMSHVIPELLKKAHSAKQGDAIEVFSTDHSRTFCFVDDAVNMMRLAAENSGCENETLNIGSEQPEIIMGDLAQIIFRVVGKDLGQRVMPATPGSPVRRCPDMKKTIRLTGYTPRVSLQEGVQSTYSWYLRQVFEGKGVCAK